MSATDTQTDAIARVYARSLFTLADAQGGQKTIESVASELENILEIARGNERFSEFLASKILSTDKRRNSLRAIFGGRCSDLVLRFLLVLNDKGRLSKLQSIAGAYDALLQERFGRVEVDVFTASPLSDKQRKDLESRLRDAIGKEPILHAYTDESIIGGVRVLIGDQLIDASVASRIRRMAEQLATTGASEVRARAGRIIES